MARQALSTRVLARNMAKRRRYVGRKLRVSRLRGLRQPVQYFKRTQYINDGIVIAPNPVPAWRTGAYSFNMVNIPSVTDFTTLYDQYKIKGIKFTLIPKYNSVDIGPNPTSGNIIQQTQVATVLDYDDINNPGTLDVLLQYQSLKITRGGKTHSRYFKPSQLTNVYRGALVPDGHSVSKAKWNDMAYLDIVHYGVKWAIQENASVPLNFDVKIDYYLAMKNVH